MATASSSLHQPMFPQYPSLSRSSRFHPPLRLSSLRFPSRIRASSAVALEPESSTQLNNGLEFDLFSCPVCYEPLIRKGPPGLNLPAIYRSGFKCRSCNKSYSSKDMYLDLTITAGSKDYNELQPNRTELFRSPLVSFLYERGWRQNFNRSGFPGRDEEFKMAQEYFKPVIGGLLVDVSCGSGLFSRKFAESGTYSGVVALDFSENMLRQCYDFIKKENPALATTNLALVRADVSRLPFSTGSVDAVHAGAALHCWPSPSNAVAEITRILRSGGIFVGTTFLRPSFGNSSITSILRPFRRWERSLQNYNNLTEKEIEDLCTSCGLINYRSKESSPQLNNDMDFDLFSCPVCYEPLIRKGPPGLNLPAIYRSGFKCKTCNKSYSSKDMYLDLTITAGSKAYNEAQPVRTELFRSPLVSFLYERGWRQNFNLRGFPGPDEEFKMAQEYFKPAAGGLLVDVSCGSGLFSRKFAESGTYSGVVALDFSENMLRQCYDFIKKDNPSLTTNLALVRADISRLPFSSGSVDAVHAGAALHCWPSPSNAVAEITRILRSGGIFVGTTFLRPTYTNSSIPAILRPFRQSILQTSNYLTEKEIEDLCRSCALINYTSTIQQSFIMFSAQKA